MTHYFLLLSLLTISLSHASDASDIFDAMTPLPTPQKKSNKSAQQFSSGQEPSDSSADQYKTTADMLRSFAKQPSPKQPSSEQSLFYRKGNTTIPKGRKEAQNTPGILLPSITDDAPVEKKQSIQNDSTLEILQGLLQQETMLWQKEANLSRTKDSIQTFTKDMEEVVNNKKEIITQLTVEQIKELLLQPKPQEERANLFFDLCQFWKGDESTTMLSVHDTLAKKNKNVQKDEIKLGGILHGDFTESRKIARVIHNIATLGSMNDDSSFFQTLSDTIFVKNKFGRFLKKLFFGKTQSDFFRILGNAKTLKDILSIDKAFPKTVYLASGNQNVIQEQEYQAAWKKIKQAKIETIYNQAVRSKNNDILQALQDAHNKGDLVLQEEQVQKITDLLQPTATEEFIIDTGIESTDGTLTRIETKEIKPKQDATLPTQDSKRNSSAQNNNSATYNAATDRAIQERKAREENEKAAYEVELKKRAAEQERLKRANEKMILSNGGHLHAESAV